MLRSNITMIEEITNIRYNKTLHKNNASLRARLYETLQRK